MQESGLTKIIPLIRTSAVWGQYPVFSHPKVLRAYHREWLQSEGCSMAGILSFLSSLRAYQLMGVAAITDDCDILVY